MEHNASHSVLRAGANFVSICARFKIVWLLLMFTWLQTQNVLAAPGPVSWVSISSGCSGNSPEISLAWTTATGATSYNIYRGGNIYKTGLTGTSYQDSGVTGGTTYTYFIQAVNSVGATQTGSLGSTAPSNCGGSAPGPVSWVSISSGCSGNSPEISLAWTTATGATSYYIYRNNSFLTSVTGTTYQDLNVTGGTTYSYFIQAVNSVGATQTGSLGSTAPSNCGVSSPSITISSPAGGENWTAGTTRTVTWIVSGTPPSSISYYGIDYSLDGGSTWTYNAAYAFPPATSASWVIPSTKLTTQARVQVRAVNSSGSSMFWNYSANNFIINAPGQNPVANPTADNHAPLSGQQVNFTGSGSTDPTVGCSIISYLWNFGDGTTSTLTNPSHTFLSPSGSSASYTVSLQVTDSCGNTGANSLNIYVTGQALGNNPQQAFSKDPVNLATGNYTYNHVDLQIASRGLPFEFQRYYNSKATTSANLPLGFGWTHSYNIYLSINASNSAVIAFGDGHQETYATNGAGGYVSEPGIFNTLVSSGGGFTLTTKEPEQYNFNLQGQLASISDKNNNTVYLAYTGNSLTTITDTVGRVISFAYDTNNCLTNISDPLGRSVQFAYDANTNLISATDLRGGVTQFGYDSFHQITNAIDPRGNTFVSMVYDAQKRVVSSQKDALLNSTTFSYDFVSGITTVTDAMANVCYYHYDPLLRVTEIDDNLGNKQFFGYDTNNNRILVIDKNGYATAYAYDGNGNVISKTDPFLKTTTISYDSRNNPTNRTDALNGVTVFQYDSNGNLTNTINASGTTNSYAYDAFGDPILVADANGNTSTNTYDSFGNLIETQDALGDTNGFAYDIVSRKIQQVDALGRTNLFIYDNADNLTASVNALGKTNYFRYDGNNNRVTATDFLGNTTTNFYDQKDRLIITRDPLGDSVTNAYDALDRKILVSDAMGGVTRYGYDADGNLLAITNAVGGVTQYAYDPNGNRTNMVDALGNSMTNVFDFLNRFVSTEDALGHTTTSAFDSLGRRIQTIDALNRTSYFNYDAMGRLTNFTDTAGGTVVNAYDNVGNRIFSTDPNGHTTTNVFDALNRLVKTIDPKGGVLQLAYDAAGNLISRTDPNGNITTYLYDANNRRTKITYPTGSPVTFGYDDNGNRTSMTDSLGTTIYSYDSLNRITSVTDCYGKTVSYGYDKNGNRTSVKYPGNKNVSYAYDAANRLKTVTDWLNNVTTYNYDANGNLTNTVNPNGTVANYRYDAANRLSSLTNSTASSTVISSYQYTLDAVGNHSQVNQTEQLQTAPVTGQFTNAYDSDNQMVIFEGQTQGFDTNGNMVSIGGTNLFSYDFENRLVQSMLAGVTNAYQYDGAGNRLSATRGGLVTRYVLDRNSPQSQVLAETDSGGNITAYYIYGLGLVSKIDSGGNAHYYHYDSRGSAVALTDASGHVTDAYAYDPFGITTAVSGSTDNRFRYLGRHGVVDEENGLNYIRARYYSAQCGRFITKDPTTGKDGDSESMNRYIYALNNPVRLIDISGLNAEDPGGFTSYSQSSDTLHNFLVLISSDEVLNRVIGLGNLISTIGSDPSVLRSLQATEGLGKVVSVTGYISGVLNFIESTYTDAGFNHIVSNVENAPSNVSWLVHDGDSADWLNFGSGITAPVSAVSLNAIGLIPGVGGEIYNSLTATLSIGTGKNLVTSDEIQNLAGVAGSWLYNKTGF